MILASEVLMGRHKTYPLDDKLLDNLGKLLVALNVVRKAYGKPLIVSSGYRPGSFNKAAGGATNSSHLTLEACDFDDPGRAFSKWCLANLKVLEEAGLWMENPAKTIGWVHLQIRPTNQRVFNP
jgi:zinc D-Ala-D-Ala carboxypeptidase